jgi:hypothetical protein
MNPKLNTFKVTLEKISINIINSNLTQTLEMSGHIRVLHGQAVTPDETPTALFALCCPFGSLPLVDMPPREYVFKTKHRMDLAPISMDPRLVQTLEAVN